MPKENRHVNSNNLIMSIDRKPNKQEQAPKYSDSINSCELKKHTDKTTEKTLAQFYNPTEFWTWPNNFILA